MEIIKTFFRKTEQLFWKNIQDIRTVTHEIFEEKDKEKRLMRLNRYLSSKEILRNVLLGIDIILFLGFNYIVNLLANLLLGHYKSLWSMVHILPGINGIRLFWWMYILLIFFLVILDVSFYYRVHASLSEDNFNVNQKGSSRFTTVEELKQQYRQIDEREGTYEGLPGILISQYEGKHFIDDGNTNTCIIGITRAGKDEIFIQPSINDYSRAEIKPSIVTIDPKGESYRCTKGLLEQRGYQVLLYNLADPEYSIEMNYMQNMIELYKKGDYAAAENLAYSYSYSLFTKDAGDQENAFFWENAAALFAALILAHIEDCLYEDKKENTIRYKVFQQKQENFAELSEKKQREARETFFLYQGEDYITDKKVKYIPENIVFQESNRNEKCANIYSVIVMFSELSRDKNPETGTTALDTYFNIRPATDRAKLKYLSIEVSSDRARGDIYATMAVRLTTFMQESVAKMSLSSSFRMEDLGFGKQPIAIFLLIPDYDTSLHNLASIFISQSYYALAKACEEHMKCTRPVKYILNECGNIPKIMNLANMSTVCLGRNITLDIYLQSVPRFKKIYGKDADTILSNCGNQIYLMGNDYETAEYFSKMIGNRTIIDIQRTGEKLSLNKTFMERPDKNPLLDPNELLELKPGHCVVRRAMKRYDLQGNKIRPRPIYNNDEDGTALRYRHEYLKDLIPDPDSIKLSEVLPPKIKIDNMQDYIFDYKNAMKRFMKNQNIVGDKTLGEIPHSAYEMIENLLLEGLGADMKDILGWSQNMTLQDLIVSVCEADIRKDIRELIILKIKEQMK